MLCTEPFLWDRFVVVHEPSSGCLLQKGDLAEDFGPFCIPCGCECGSRNGLTVLSWALKGGRSEIRNIRAYGLYLYIKTRMRSLECSLSPIHSNMSQVPKDRRNNMQSSRVELHRSIGNPSHPREHEVNTQTQVSLRKPADYSSARKASLFKVIPRATHQATKGRR